MVFSFIGDGIRLVSHCITKVLCVTKLNKSTLHFKVFIQINILTTKRRDVTINDIQILKTLLLNYTFAIKPQKNDLTEGTMFNRQLKYLNRLRSLPVFLLIGAFLVLSYCPLRTSIQDLLKSIHRTEQANAGHNKKLVFVVCPGVVNSADTKLTLPEPAFDISILAFTPIDLTSFYPLWGFSSTEKDLTFYRDVSLHSLNTVPLYLRNRILLI